MDVLDVTVGVTFGLPDPKKKFGIEIELEGQQLLPRLPEGKWYAKPDGSLRDGMEYITKPTDTPRDDVNALQTILRNNNAVIKNSYRCSTHIHYNYVGQTWKNVVATIIAWQIAEPLFLRQMPPGRDGSIFCMSAYDTGDLPVYFHNFCEELRHKFQREGFQAVCRQKYAALNITRLCDLGTMEWRIFPPSLDGTEVRKWCMWIDNLVALAGKTNPNEFSQFIRHIEENPSEFAREIFHDLPASNAEIAALVDLGCRTSYELVRVFNAAMKKKIREKKEVKSVNPEHAVRRFAAAAWPGIAPFANPVVDDLVEELE